MYISAAIVMILTQLVSVVATMIDGIITSRFYGEEAYSAISLVTPYTKILVTCADMISIGCQLLYMDKLKQSGRDGARAAFTFSVLLGLGIAILFSAFSVCFPGLVCRISGVTADKEPFIYTEMRNYLYGYLPGAPALMLARLLSPMVMVDGQKKLVTRSAILMCVLDIGFDLINVMVFDGGTFGMGIATSLAYWAQAAVLLVYVLRKSNALRFTLRGAKFGYSLTIFRNGSAKALQRAAGVLRDLVVNKINIVIALTTGAIAARGIQGDINSFLFSIGAGLGSALLPMAGMYYSAGDRNGLTRLVSCAVKFACALTAAIAVLLAVFSKPIALFYSSDPETISLIVFAILCICLSLVVDTLLSLMQSYLQGVKNMKMVRFICFAERFFAPVLTAVALSLTSGSRGVLASVTVSEFLLAMIVLCIICVKNRRFPRGLSDFMLLPAGFGGKENDSVSVSITDTESMMDACALVRSFCEKHSFQQTVTNHMVLCVEEMAGNVIEHGRLSGRKKPVIDLRANAAESEDGTIQSADGRTYKLSLTLRDNCRAFDPKAYYEQNESTDRDCIGLKLILGLARDISYMNVFGTNEVILEL